MADNPFTVNVPSIYEALMTGQQSYDTSRKRSLNDQLGKALSSGQIDYRAAAGLAAQNGDPGLALGLTKLGADREAQKDYEKTFGGLIGGNQPATSGPLPALMRPPPQRPSPVDPTRAEVQPSAKVWGDRELADQGGYDTSIPKQTMDPGLYDPAVTRPGQRTAQAPPQAPPGVPNRSNPTGGPNINALIAATMHPGASAGQRDAAKALLQEALKTPDNIREYDLYTKQERASGRQPLPFLDYQIKLKTAGATMINTAEGMDAAQTKARLKLDADTVEPLAKQVASGRKALPLLDRVADLATKTPGGWSGQASPALAKALSSVGFEVPEGLSNAELFRAATRQMIPGVRDPGSTSNYEQQLYAEGVPNLAQSKEGRLKVAEMHKALLTRGADIVAIYRQHLGEPQLDAKLKELDSKPIFSAEQRKALEGAGGGPKSGPIKWGDGPDGRPAPVQQ